MGRGIRLTNWEGSTGSDRGLGDDPFVGGAADGGDAFEVGLVVQDGESGCELRRRDDEEPVLAAAGEFVLQVNGGRHHLGGDGCGVERAPFLEALLVVAERLLWGTRTQLRR